MAKQTSAPKESPAPRIETILAYMAAGLIGTSVLVMIITLIMAASSAATPTVGATNLLPLMVFYPQFGLAAGALCIILLLVFNIRRRSRENRSN
ncbi:hypothetical protein [Rhodoluna sp.]|jgi:uncharacterized membrane protein|uniref:hypothetical protein n=1 Tax=Rhodoluna sp. TaxID=1969481 RepID=UPI0025F73B6F|nr:hypothetical protein [Rhodoluna sp.]